MLAVVEHDQRRPVADVVGNHPDRPSTRLGGQADRVEHRARQRTRITHRRQLHPPHSTVEVVDRLGSDLQRQPRLADAARADQRHEATVIHRRQHRSRVRFTTDQRRQTGRQLWPNTSERSQRREVDVTIAMTQLPHPLSSAQIIQPVRTHVAKVRTVEQTLADELARRVRHEHLATVADRPQPRAPDDRRAEVPASSRNSPHRCGSPCEHEPRQTPVRAARRAPPTRRPAPPGTPHSPNHPRPARQGGTHRSTRSPHPEPRRGAPLRPPSSPITPPRERPPTLPSRSAGTSPSRTARSRGCDLAPQPNATGRSGSLSRPQTPCGQGPAPGLSKPRARLRSPCTRSAGPPPNAFPSGAGTTPSGRSPLPSACRTQRRRCIASTRHPQNPPARPAFQGQEPPTKPGRLTPRAGRAPSTRPRCQHGAAVDSRPPSVPGVRKRSVRRPKDVRVRAVLGRTLCASYSHPHQVWQMFDVPEADRPAPVDLTALRSG